jgi:hypothetical protein
MSLHEGVRKLKSTLGLLGEPEDAISGIRNPDMPMSMSMAMSKLLSESWWSIASTCSGDVWNACIEAGVISSILSQVGKELSLITLFCSSETLMASVGDCDCD